MRAIAQYLATMQNGKIVLWCYLIWYLTTVYFHFDPAPQIWINALGISAIIGFALMLSVSAGGGFWQNSRLFMMPFGVSSFSALIKGKSFVFIFSPVLNELFVSASLCVGFVAIVLLFRHKYRAVNVGMK